MNKDQINGKYKWGSSKQNVYLLQSWKMMVKEAKDSLPAEV